MDSKSRSASTTSGARITRRTFAAGAGALALTAGAAPFNIARAAGGPLKIGVILPRSGYLAGIGQDCQRGADVALPILKELGMPDVELIPGDTESSVDGARSRAEKMIADGVQILVGAFDSGQSSAIAQVAEQKGIPFVINIAAAPDITEQGYKFVFRNFPIAPRILGDAFANMIEVFSIANASPKSAVFVHANDTFGTAMSKGFGAVAPKFPLPFKVVEEIAYDPTSKDLSVEVAKAKATNAELLIVVSRLNDAILMTRELVKQRWTPTAILSMGPGWYEDQYMKTLGKLSDGPMSFAPWYDPNKKLTPVLQAALAKAFPETNMNTNHVFTFEALLTAADAFKRAGSTDPKALADALRTTDITDNVAIGGGIMFDAKGQNTKVGNGAIQNRGGKHVTVAPKASANAQPVWPLPPFGDR